MLLLLLLFLSKHATAIPSRKKSGANLNARLVYKRLSKLPISIGKMTDLENSQKLFITVFQFHLICVLSSVERVYLFFNIS